MLTDRFDGWMIPVLLWFGIEPDPVLEAFTEGRNPIQPAPQFLLSEAVNGPAGLKEFPGVHAGIADKDQAGLFVVFFQHVSRRRDRAARRAFIPQALVGAVVEPIMVEALKVIGF